MQIAEADRVARLAVELHLISPEQLRECQVELGDSKPAPRHGGPGVSARQLLSALERRQYLTPYQADRLLKGERAGYFYGRYKVLYRIASGSFARVYRAADPDTGGVVALKVMRNRWTSDPKTVALFQREGELGKTLRHPNIVPIYEVAREGDQFYLVMEFVEGGNFRDFLKIRKKLAPDEAVRFVTQMADGLDYAFRRGYSHRDLKLTNVLISAQGVAKLVDFGLAWSDVDSDTAAEIHGQRTIDYAALEKLTGVKRGDSRSDLYFLGCIFYQLLTGQAPMPETRDRVARMRRSRFENVRPITELEPDLPRAVVELVEKLMSLYPDRRYQDPGSVARDLRAVAVELSDPSRNRPPAASRAGEEGQESPDWSETPPAGLRRRSLLCLQGSPELQELLRRHFSQRGYRVFVIGDLQRGLDRFRDKPTDCVLVDAEAFGQPAVETFKKLLAGPHDRAAYVLLVSDREQPYAANLPDHPRAAVLLKPVTLREVRDKFDAMLGPD